MAYCLNNNGLYLWSSGSYTTSTSVQVGGWYKGTSAPTGGTFVRCLYEYVDRLGKGYFLINQPLSASAAYASPLPAIPVWNNRWTSTTGYSYSSAAYWSNYCGFRLA